MTWHNDFTDRMKSWAELRSQVENLPIQDTLEAINYWWQRTPWQPYYLHWDDLESWPDPWQLLSDNVYCDVARGLGIMYTISMLDRKDLGSATMVFTSDGLNLVLVAGGKYIVNWDQEILVNSNLAVNIKRQLKLEELKQYK